MQILREFFIVLFTKMAPSHVVARQELQEKQITIQYFGSVITYWINTLMIGMLFGKGCYWCATSELQKEPDIPIVCFGEK